MLKPNKIVIPCDLCGKEPAHWSGNEEGTNGIFICNLCKSFDPKEQFKIALTLAKEKT